MVPVQAFSSAFYLCLHKVIKVQRVYSQCVLCAGCAGGQRVARCLPRSDGRQVPLPHLLWTQVSVLRLDCLNGSHWAVLHRISGNLSLATLSHHAATLLSFRSSRVKSHLFSLPYWQYVWCVLARPSSFWLFWFVALSFVMELLFLVFLYGRHQHAFCFDWIQCLPISTTLSRDI